MSKQISTKTTIRNLTAEIKKTFVKKDAFTPVQTAANAAIKSLGVDGNTVKFYTSTDKSGTAAFSVDFPSELFLDQTKTTFVAKFKFDAATYPGATDPKLDGKPVMVLAVKGENPDSCTYSFLSMAALVDTYKAKAVGKDASTTVTIAGYAPFPRTSKRKSGTFSARRRRRLRPSSTSSPPKEDRNGKELCM